MIGFMTFCGSVEAAPAAALAVVLDDFLCELLELREKGLVTCFIGDPDEPRSLIGEEIDKPLLLELFLVWSF